MTNLETVLLGLLISVISLTLGKLWGEHGKVDEEHCLERQEVCASHLCSELKNIKESQKELKANLDDIRDRIYEIHSAM